MNFHQTKRRIGVFYNNLEYYEYYQSKSLRNKPSNQAVTTFEYDSMRRVVKTTLADGTFSSATYGPYGPTSQTDRAGRVSTVEYDTLGRRVSSRDAKGQVINASMDRLLGFLGLAD